MAMIKLGLCLPKLKQSRRTLRSRIESLCLKANIQVIDVDIDQCLELQGPFDVLLHKVVDYFKMYEQGEAKEKVNKLIRYAAKHERMIVMDDFQLCLNIMQRQHIVAILKSCQFTLDGITVFSPKTIVVTEELSKRDVLKSIVVNNLRFPVIVKAHSACLDENCHEMALIFNENGVKDISTPCILQEFCNHGGVYYKVFVIGRNYNVCENPSIQDIDSTFRSDSKTIFFNAREISKVGKPFHPYLHGKDPNMRKWLTCDEKPNMLDRSVTEEIISKLNDKTGCSLFKVDILIESRTGNYLLIDFNQFPSYAGINEKYFPKYFVQHIRDLYASRIN